MIDLDAESLDSSHTDGASDELIKQTTTAPANSRESPSNALSSDGEKFIFGISPMFKDCKVSAIGRDTVYKVEFRFQNIDRNLILFRKEIIERCRAHNIKGYICFRSNQTKATGIMEGAIKDINSIKQWVGLASDFIEEPLKLNVFFTWFLIASKPSKLEFDVMEPASDSTDSNDTSRSSST